MTTHIGILIFCTMILCGVATKKLSCKQKVEKIKNVLGSIPSVEKQCNTEITLPCGPPVVKSAVWSTYVRWGRSVCPDTNGTSVLYTGVAAGSHYTHSGGGSNFLCLPNEPEWGNYINGLNGVGAHVYGAEYEFHTSYDIPFKAANAPDTSNPNSLHNHDVPCVVCQIPRNVAMIPALHTCPNGWNREYKGYLVAGHHAHANNVAFECMDEAPEAIDGGHENKNGALFHSTQAVCVPLPCPKYEGGRELTCVVCSK